MVRAINGKPAVAGEIPTGLESSQSYNRTATVEIELGASIATAAGEIVGGLLEIFDDSVRRNYDGLTLLSVSVVDRDDQKTPFFLHIFNQKPAVYADGDDLQSTATWQDLVKRKKTISSADYTWRTANSIAYMDLDGLGVPIDTRHGEQGPFYAALELAGAHASTNGLILSLTFWID